MYNNLKPLQTKWEKTITYSISCRLILEKNYRSKSAKNFESIDEAIKYSKYAKEEMEKFARYANEGKAIKFEYVITEDITERKLCKYVTEDIK